MSAEQTTEVIRRARLISIVRLESEAAIAAAAEALATAGVRVLEVSLAVSGALTALRRLRDALGERLTLGAGTVLTAHDAAAAVDAGARFLVSPNLDRQVIDEARRLEVLHIPGALTPTEVVNASATGARLIKLFPASRLGPGYVKDLLAPLPDLELVPTGGVDRSNAAEFLEAGATALAVGGALVNERRLATPGALEQEAKAYIQLIAATEGGTK